MLSIASRRKSRMICWSSEVLDSWDARFESIKSCSDIILLSYFSKMFCFSLSKPFKTLVQWLSGRHEILQTFRDSAVSSEPILSSADVFQHILDFAVL